MTAGVRCQGQDMGFPILYSGSETLYIPLLTLIYIYSLTCADGSIIIWCSFISINGMQL